MNCDVLCTFSKKLMIKSSTRLLRSPLSPQDPNLYRPNKKYKMCVSLSSKKVKNFQKSQTYQQSNDIQNISNSTIMYLDLSRNSISSDMLSTLGENLVSLNLANNPLKSCKIPCLQRLRTLNMDNCCIPSLQGLPVLPSLKRLSLNGNPIMSFNGCPILPKLESVNILKFPVKLIIAAFGSIYINVINKKKLTDTQLYDAFALSPIVGIALRNGREVIELETPEDEMKASLAFLTVDLRDYLENSSNTTEPKLVIKQRGNKHVLQCPLEAKSYKWYAHTYPDKGSEWKLIKNIDDDENKKNLKKGYINTTKDHIPITMAIRLHIIKCEIIIGDKTFSIYNDEPIGKSAEDLSLPYPVTPVITGTPIENSLISVLPTPVPCKAIWAMGTETIDRDKNSIIIPHDAIGSAIACVLQPHCPKNPNIAFSPIFASTDVVMPLLPTVGGIQFPEVLVECETLFFQRVVIPDNEGESEIYVERAQTPSSEWVLCKQLTPDCVRYKPKSADIDHFLRVSYTPITKDGTRGKTVYFYSQSKVIPTAPTFFNPMIGGVAKTNYPLIALADYTGGKKGKCSYEWYFSRKPIDTSHGPSKRLKKVATTQIYTPPLNFAEGYLAVLMVPVRDDDIIGDPVFATIDQALQIEDPPKPLQVPDEAVVGTRIKFEKPVDILLSKTSGYFGFDYIKTSQTFTPREKHIGRILRVVSPGSDTVIGEIKPAIPVISAVYIESKRWQAGSTAEIKIKQTNLRPDKVEILWIRANAGFQKAVAINVPEYAMTNEDVGYTLQVVATPISYEGQKLKPCYSKVTPVIQPEGKTNLKIIGQLIEGKELSLSISKNVQSITWYHLSNKNEIEEIGHGPKLSLATEDVDKFIRVTVVLENGAVLTTTTNAAVSPLKCEVILPQIVTEGDLITPQVNYYCGSEGLTKIKWSAQINNKWVPVGENLNYQVTAKDIGCLLKFECVPNRYDEDKKQKQKIELVCGPVEEAMPSVKNVKLFQNDDGDIECTGEYFGGVEGNSLIIWRVYNENNVPVNIGKTVDRKMRPTDEFVNKVVEAGYVPIREDGIGGQPVMSNKLKVEPLPVVETAEILVKKGKVEDNNPMRIHATVPPGCNAVYQWYYGDGTNWQKIVNATDVQYTPTEKEIGFYILCSVVAINKKGWKSFEYAAVTSKAVAASTSTLKILTNNDSLRISLLDTKTPNNQIYTGMIISTNISIKELRKTEIAWQRESKPNKWKDILNSDTYIVTCNDVGCRLRVADSKGRVSEPTNVIEYNPNVLTYINAILKTSNMKFVAKPKFGHTTWYAGVSSYGVSLESSEKKKKQSKWSLVKVEAVNGTDDEMILWMDPSSKFHFIPSLSHDPRLESLIKKENVRDFVVSVILGLKAEHQK